MLWGNQAVSWFEIPTTDLARATQFYEAIFGIKLQVTEGGPMKMSIFPIDGPGVHGALVNGETYVPSEQGSLVYFNAGSDLAGILDRVRSNGGTVLMEKKSIGPHGFVGVFRDTEGNRVALHATV